jgi:hypothetical protein
MPTIALSFYDHNGLVKWVKGKKKYEGEENKQ